MILPICGINSCIPRNYKEVLRKLKALGISPTGNVQLDKIRLKEAIEAKVEKLQAEKLEQEKRERKSIENLQDNKQKGAITLAELNRIYHNI